MGRKPCVRGMGETVDTLEPLSKSFEQHRDGCELDKAQKVGPVMLPADEQAPLPLQPGKEALDEPAALLAAEGPTVLGLEFPGRPVWCNHVHAVLLEVSIEPIAGTGTIANQVLGLGLQHVEVETELY